MNLEKKIQKSNIFCVYNFGSKFPEKFKICTFFHQIILFKISKYFFCLQNYFMQNFGIFFLYPNFQKSSKFVLYFHRIILCKISQYFFVFKISRKLPNLYFFWANYFMQNFHRNICLIVPFYGGHFGHFGIFVVFEFLTCVLYFWHHW